MLPGSEIWKPSKGALFLRKIVGLLSLVLLVGTLPLYYNALSFQSFTVVTAIVSSVLSTIAAVLSILGALSYSRPTLVGGLTLLLTSSALTLYLQECAGRDAVVHCSLADLESRINEVEEVERMRNHGDVVLAVFSRLDELQQELDLSQSGKLKSSSDTALIMTKLDELAKMAREVIEERENTGQLQGDQQETADIVENRIEAAKVVISKLQAAKKRTSASGQYEMSPEEMNSILTALTEAYVGSPNTGAQKSGNMQTKESLQRSKKLSKVVKEIGEAKRGGGGSANTGDYGAYDYSYDAGDYGGYEQHPDYHTKHERRQNREWAKEFKNAISTHRLRRVGMRSMPEMCLKELPARKVVDLFGPFLVGLDLTLAYCVMSLLFRIPLKTD